jgi:hypothetical protein
MASVDADLIDELLYANEGVDLDFKREQYPWVNVSDLDKAELLKDILAFSNSFRRGDAHILIGVDEPPNSRPQLVGITTHLPDADLQQFVNSKTNRKVLFSYHVVVVRGMQVGVIRIEKQHRPIFLTRDFAFDQQKKRSMLTANTVYMRVGSSTTIATPDDIARMGSPVRETVFDLDLQFANTDTKKPLGTTLGTTHEAVTCSDPIPEFTSYSPPSSNPYGIAIPQIVYPFDRDNRNFWREADQFFFFETVMARIGFCIENRSNVTLTDVTVEFSFPKVEGLVVFAKESAPDKPSKKDPIMASIARMVHMVYSVNVETHHDRHLVTLSFGKLQAGERAFLGDVLYFACAKSNSFILDAVIRADEFEAPLRKQLQIDANGMLRSVPWSEYKPMLSAFMKSAG